MLVCLLALSSLCLSSPLGEFGKELENQGLDVDKIHAELKRESNEIEEEFAGKETQEELSKLRAAYDTSHGTNEVETELEINGDLSEDLFEGDIVLTPEQRARALDRDPKATRLRLQGITDDEFMWTPMGAPVIPYSFADGFPADKKQIVTDSLAFWEGRTCITFRPANETDENLLEFNHNTTRCNSQIGMAGGKQTMNLAPHCFRMSTITHELSHTFGTMHIQMRSDRDDYIIVDNSNIKQGGRHNFRKDPGWRGMDNYGIPYEFGSLMHYYDKAAAINTSKPTIYAKDEYSMYQGSMSSPVASFYDTLLINKMYKCTEKCKNHILCENNGVQDGSNCNKCFCPKGWEGITCEKRPNLSQVIKLTANQQINMRVPAGNGGLQTRLYVIEAPIGKRISASVTAIGNYLYKFCDKIGFEIIPSKDTRLNGIRFCRKPDPTPIESDSHEMNVWMYNELANSMWTRINFTLF